MLLRETTRPRARSEMFERFRLADASEWIPKNRLDQSEYAKRNFAVCFDPELEIFTELRMKNGFALF